MRIPTWLMIVNAILLAACGTSSQMSSGTPGIGATTSPLATAQVARHPVADRVIPLAAPTLGPTLQVMAANAATMSPTAILKPSPSAAAAATSPAMPEPSPAVATATIGEDPAMLEALLVAAINQQRAVNGMPPYQHSPELSAAARGHSCDLATHGLISHTSSDGRTLAQRLEGANPPWEWPSENVAAGVADPAAAVAMWMDEPPDGWHRRNILDAAQREVGAGYCFVAEDSTGNHFYWTADFSRRSTS